MLGLPNEHDQISLPLIAKIQNACENARVRELHEYKCILDNAASKRVCGYLE